MPDVSLRYPLSWPTGWKRTRSGDRKRAPFHSTSRSEQGWVSKLSLSVGDATTRLSAEMRRLGVTNWLISSNLRVRIDGMPYADQRNPDDVGVAVYFRRGKADQVLACDRWLRIADNLAAIAGHVEALRAMERYGVGTMDQAFAGYVGLPAKGSTWRTTLGFKPDAVVTLEQVQAAFRDRARSAHPDIAGGSHDAMASLTSARDEAAAELGARS